jgi:hypothetical protein
VGMGGFGGRKRRIFTEKLVRDDGSSLREYLDTNDLL